MPSSHSATVAALAVAIGFQDGVGASSFALAVVLSAIVCALTIIDLFFFNIAILVNVVHFCVISLIIYLFLII